MQRLWPCLAWSCFPPSNFRPCGLLEVKVSGWDVPAAPKAKSKIPLHVMNEKDPALSWDVIGSGWFGSCTSGPKISQRRQSNPSSQVDLCYTETWPVSFAASDCSEWKNVFNEYGHSWNFAGYTHHCSFVEGTSTQLSHHSISTTWGSSFRLGIISLFWGAQMRATPTKHPKLIGVVRRSRAMSLVARW